jgi:hypothetical protein
VKSLELYEFVRKLCLYFERRPPSNETIEQWYPEVEHIPSEPLDWIAVQIKHGDAFPRNLPEAMRLAWSDWWQAHPEKRAKEKELGCENCHLGYLYVSYFDQTMGQWYDTTFRCAYCRPKYPMAMATATVEDLAGRGYCRPISTVLLPYAKGLPTPTKTEITVKPVKPGPLNTIVEQASGAMELPF